jgi:hypothetical protein
MRLIDADALNIDEEVMRACECAGMTEHSGESGILAGWIIGAINLAKTIDAVPVVRGEWELYGNDDDSGMSYWCTACNFQLSEDLFYSGYKNGRWIENGVFKYCPNCGAKMESEGST